MKPLPTHPRRGGFVIMEVLCAIMVFGLAVTGLMKAMGVSAQSAIISQLELRMLLRMQSTLNEYSKYPRIEEYEGQVFETDPDELGVWTRTEILKIEGAENSEQQPLENMYEVVVTAYYDNFGQVGEMQANTVRYSRLYSTTGATAGGTPTPTPTPPRP